MKIHKQQLYEYITIFHKNNLAIPKDVAQLEEEGWEVVRTPYSCYKYPVKDLGSFKEKYGEDIELNYATEGVLTPKIIGFSVYVTELRRELNNFDPNDIFN